MKKRIITMGIIWGVIIAMGLVGLSIVIPFVGLPLLILFVISWPIVIILKITHAKIPNIYTGKDIKF
jgi:hypothetical protein